MPIIGGNINLSKEMREREMNTQAPFYGLNPSMYVRQLTYNTQVRIWQRLSDMLDNDTAQTLMDSRVHDLAEVISLDGVVYE